MALCVSPKQLQTQLTFKILLLFQVNLHWNIGNTKWGRQYYAKSQSADVIILYTSNKGKYLILQSAEEFTLTL